eukprot:scaffold1837_cov102-Isochrysis_galbana.AAC.6
MGSPALWYRARPHVPLPIGFAPGLAPPGRVVPRRQHFTAVAAGGVNSGGSDATRCVRRAEDGRGAPARRGGGASLWGSVGVCMIPMGDPSGDGSHCGEGGWTSLPLPCPAPAPAGCLATVLNQLRRSGSVPEGRGAKSSWESSGRTTTLTTSVSQQLPSRSMAAASRPTVRACGEGRSRGGGGGEALVSQRLPSRSMAATSRPAVRACRLGNRKPHGVEERVKVVVETCGVG